MQNPIKHSLSSRRNVRLHVDTRRDLLGYVVLSILPGDLFPQVSLSNRDGMPSKSMDDIRPSAPVDALLPATRVQNLIIQAVNLTHQLVILSNEQNEKEEDDERLISVLGQLHYIFSDPHINVIGGPTKLSDALVAEPHISSYYKRAYIDELKSLPLTEILPAVLTQLGNYRQFSLLRNRQKTLEQENSFRAAFNIYTRQLRFDSERYIWTASLEERKKFIRQYDALPDVTTVITSDLDLRDLIRNQILDSWDDARGEFYYQITERMNITLPFSSGVTIIRNSFRNGEWRELEALVLRSKTFCEEWFALIPEQDQVDARTIVFKEG